MKKVIIASIIALLLSVPVFADVEIGARMVGAEIIVPQITIDLNQGFIPSLTAFKPDIYDDLSLNGVYSAMLTWNAPFIVYNSLDFKIAFSFYFGAGITLLVDAPALAVQNAYAVVGAKVDCGEAGALFADISIAQDGSYITSVGGTLSLPSLDLKFPPAE